jgi:predicted ester cyclase
MSIEQNKAVVRRIYDQLINQEQPGVVDETFAEDAIIHDPFMGIVNGREAFKQLLGMFDAAFPGHRVEVHTMIAEGDWVSVIHTHTALHTGPFMNLPPTGREVIVPGVEIFRLSNKRIVEFWRHDDDAGLLRQLGVLAM